MPTRYFKGDFKKKMAMERSCILRIFFEANSNLVLQGVINVPKVVVGKLDVLGANPNARVKLDSYSNEDEVTPLELAAKNGHTEIVALLKPITSSSCIIS